MPWADAFFPPGMIMREMKVIETPQISLHICFVFQKAASLLMSVAKKNSLVFPIRQAGLVKPSLQPPVALFQSSCQWRCIHRSPACKFFRWTGDGANNSCTIGFPHWGHVTQLMSYADWGCHCPVLPGLPLSWQSLVESEIQDSA